MAKPEKLQAVDGESRAGVGDQLSTSLKVAERQQLVWNCFTSGEPSQQLHQSSGDAGGCETEARRGWSSTWLVWRATSLVPAETNPTIAVS